MSDRKPPERRVVRAGAAARARAAGGSRRAPSRALPARRSRPTLPGLASTLVLAALFAAGCGSLAEKDRKAGVGLYEAGKFAEAIPRLEKALRWKPDDLEARSYLALALTRGGKPNEAIDEWLRVLKATPDWAEGHYWCGIAYLQTQRLRKAMEQWVQTVELDSTHVGAHYNLGLAYVASGMVPLAVEEWSEVLLLDPTHYEARVNRGRLRVLQGDLQGGLEDFLIALAVKPDKAINWLSLGETRFLLGDSANAVAAIDTFLARAAPEEDMTKRATMLRARIAAGEKPPPISFSPLGIVPTTVPKSVRDEAAGARRDEAP